MTSLFWPHHSTSDLEGGVEAIANAIATFRSKGHTYPITANEGDARDYDGFSE